MLARAGWVNDGIFGLQDLYGSHSLPLDLADWSPEEGREPPTSSSQLVAEAVLVTSPYEYLTSDRLQAPSACHGSDFSWFMGVSTWFSWWKNMVTLFSG